MAEVVSDTQQPGSFFIRCHSERELPDISFENKAYSAKNLTELFVNTILYCRHIHGYDACRAHICTDLLPVVIELGIKPL